MIYYLTCLPDEAWWGGVVAHGMQMPLTKSSDYELNGTINRTDNQYNALFVSSLGRYIYVENGCILRFEAGGQITLSEVKGTADISEGHGTLKGALRAASEKFERRFAAAEQLAADKGKKLADCTTDELEELWQAAKKSEKDADR